MDQSIFVGAICIIAALSVAIGFLTRVKSTSLDQYYLGGKKYGIWSLTFTILATQLGGGAIIGNAEAAYTYGWYAIFYSLGLAIGLVVLSLGFGAKLRKLEVSTVAEVFEKVYKSKALRRFASLISIVSLFFILVAIGVAARKFFISVGYGSPYWYYGFWVVAIFYTVSGGLNAVIKTDILQVVAILGVFAGVAIISFLNPSSQIDFSALPKSGEQISLINWIVIPIVFILISQDMGQRCLAAKKPELVSWATFFAAILLVLTSLVPTYLGLFAASNGLEMSSDGSILIKCVGMLTGPKMAALFAAAILMAIVSTADSLICAISSNINVDFHKFISSKTSSFTTFGVGVCAIFVSEYSNNIIPVMLFAYGISVAAMTVPIVMGITTKKPSPLGAKLSLTGGLISFIAIQTLETQIPSQDIIPLSISLLLYGLGHLKEASKSPLKS